MQVCMKLYYQYMFLMRGRVTGFTVTRVWEHEQEPISDVKVVPSKSDLLKSLIDF